MVENMQEQLASADTVCSESRAKEAEMVTKV